MLAYPFYLVHNPIYYLYILRIELKLVRHELCQNHLGKRSILDEMVAAAAESGADYAKIQSMKISNLVIRKRFEIG